MTPYLAPILGPLPCKSCGVIVTWYRVVYGSFGYFLMRNFNNERLNPAPLHFNHC